MGSGNVSPQTSPSEKALTALKKWSIGGGPGGAPPGHPPPGPHPARPPRQIRESRESGKPGFGHFGNLGIPRNLGFSEMSDLCQILRACEIGKSTNFKSQIFGNQVKLLHDDYNRPNAPIELKIAQNPQSEK